ncbi:MAG TPA: FecR domain-containing protein [Pseudomonadota bacterium]|nr:FecR domain-containing protein [Pseudomonadota bacterium]
MAELSDQIESLGKHVQADFSKRRAMAVFSRLGPMQQKRNRRRLVATVGSLVAIAVLVLWNVRTTGPSPELSLTHTRLAKVVTEKMVRLADGSLARVLDDQSRLTLFSEQPDKVVVKLRGAASFQISKNPGRLYRLETERVAIEVLGTRFSVREQTDGRVFVEVTEGRVRVSFDGQKKELSAGERGTFPLSVLSSPQTAADTVSQNKAGAVLAPDSTDRVAAPVSETGNVFSEPPKDASKPLPSVVPWLAHRRESGLRPAKATALSAKKKAIAWQSLAEQGHFEQAFSEIASRGGMSAFLRQEQLDAAELLLLGDVARYAQHAEDAVPPLKKLLRDARTDPRAPLAGFTLGRILLDDLGQPREAALAFRDASELEPDGPLAQDALAREVEAWSRAGEQSLARTRATEYVRRYPTGRRLRSVRRYGDLD